MCIKLDSTTTTLTTTAKSAAKNGGPVKFRPCTNRLRSPSSFTKSEVHSKDDPQRLSKPYSKPRGNHHLSTYKEDTQNEVDKKREIKVQIAIQNMLHSLECQGKCGSLTCEKMSLTLIHFTNCKNFKDKRCGLCNQVLGLVKFHAQKFCAVKSSEDKCSVPMCDQLRKDFVKIKNEPITN